jgi:FkbM family methyltransferase
MNRAIFENKTRNIVAAVLPLLLASVIIAGVSCKTKEVSAYEVSKEVLAPRLLPDQLDMEKYLAAFPAEQYKRYTVAGLGEFYIDKPSDIIKKVIVSGQPWELQIDKLLTKYVERGSTVLDIGAHIGTHTLPLAELVGPNGRVYAFEPQKKIYRELYYNLKLNHINNVVPLRYAIGNSPSVIEMAVAMDGNEGATAIGSGGDKAELRTIDSFGFRGVSFIKIDVEGFEDQVIDGARETLQKSRPVLIVEILNRQSHDASEEAAKLRIANSRKKIEDLGYSVEWFSNEDYLALPRK